MSWVLCSIKMKYFTRCDAFPAWLHLPTFFLEADTEPRTHISNIRPRSTRSCPSKLPNGRIWFRSSLPGTWVTMRPCGASSSRRCAGARSTATSSGPPSAYTWPCAPSGSAGRGRLQGSEGDRREARAGEPSGTPGWTGGGGWCMLGDAKRCQSQHEQVY